MPAACRDAFIGLPATENGCFVVGRWREKPDACGWRKLAVRRERQSLSSGRTVCSFGGGRHGSARRSQSLCGRNGGHAVCETGGQDSRTASRSPEAIVPFIPLRRWHRPFANQR